MTTTRLALDAFGGDNCPHTEVNAAVRAARQGIDVTLVGDEGKLASLLDAVPGAGELPLRIHHAPDVITMDDTPSKVVRGKPDASMPKCFDLVRKGDADAVVSAGNSGVMLACGLFKYGRIKGVDRPAIVTPMPTKTGLCVMLDMGANVDCRVANLVQFAVLGAVYSRFQHGHAKPRVGVLSNGEEEHKGTDLTRFTGQLLSGYRGDLFEYVGNVEGTDVYEGAADVVVTDGFTGNIALKVSEGVARMFAHYLREAINESTISKLGALLMKPAFAKLRHVMDPDTYGGAPLLGVNGIAIITHGGASEKATTNALEVGARFVDDELTPALRQAVVDNRDMFDAARRIDNGEDVLAPVKEADG